MGIFSSKERDFEEGLGVLAFGPFSLDDFTTTVLDGMRELPEEVQKGADAHWDEVRKEKPKLFNGEVWALIEYEVNRDPMGLHLKVQKSCYKHQLYTHFTAAGRALPGNHRVGSTGLMALTLTSDGLCVIGKRSEKLGQMPGYWHCMPAGNVDGPDVTAVLKKELLEEIGVSWDVGVANAMVLGILDCGEEQGYLMQVVYVLKLKIDATTLHNTMRTAEDRKEHDAISFVRCAKSTDLGQGQALLEQEISLEDFLRNKLTLVTRNALLLWSNHVDSNVLEDFTIPSPL